MFHFTIFVAGFFFAPGSRTLDNMAKWTKRDNPHTRSRTMPKAKTAQIIRYSPPRTASPIIRVSAPRAAPKKKHHHKKKGSGGAVTQQNLISLALGGAVFGFIEKSFGAQLPTLPLIGRAGSITVAAFFMAKGKSSGIMADVARAGAVLSGYQMGSTGKISGMDGEIVPQISGIAAQV